MDEIVSFFPQPTAHGAMPTVDGGERAIDSKGPMSAFVFKTMSDPYLGHLNFVKVVSGCVKPDSQVADSRTGKKERIAHVLGMRGKETFDVEGACAGDIAVLAQARATSLTNDTLSDERGRHVRADAAAGAALPRRHPGQDQGRRGQARPGDQQDRRRGADAHARARPRDAPDGALRPRRRPDRRGAVQAQEQVQRRSRDRRAAHPVPRDDPHDRARRRAATRSRPAAPASSATRGCASSRTPAAATSSSTRSSAGASRASSSPRSTRASRRRWRRACSRATRSST